MAFATSNISRESGGSVNIMRGTWTGTSGDAAGTITGRGHVIDHEFYANTTSGPANRLMSSVSNSSGTWTVTVPYFETVTAGTFTIRFK